MARPSQAALVNGALAALVKLDFGMVLNLQEAGEHAHCGPGVLRSSGFSYQPETVMAAGIGVFHMCWPDMSVPGLDAMMRIVQVMRHVCQEQQRRIAVHCHAGLGRTGLAIACYLVYIGRFGPADAVSLTRSKRPGALQTAAQELFVHVFHQWLSHLDCVYAAEPSHNNATSARSCALLWDSEQRMLPSATLGKVAAFVPRPPRSLPELIARQKHKLHGAALRHYWNVPALLVQLLRELALRIAVLAADLGAPGTQSRCDAVAAMLQPTASNNSSSALAHWRLICARSGASTPLLDRNILKFRWPC